MAAGNLARGTLVTHGDETSSIVTSEGLKTSEDSDSMTSHHISGSESYYTEIPNADAVHRHLMDLRS